MINIKKYTKRPLMALLSIIIPLGGLGGLISCTDTWDEHYQPGAMGQGNLWESIKNNQELSNFAKVIEATGYDKSLASSQVFTVFAPVNSAFTSEQADAVINQYQTELAKGLKGEKNRAIKEFVMNHIALYNYTIANETPDTTIRMMNGKYLGLTNSTFSGKPFTSTNTVTGNGILFTLAEQADFIPNLFEAVKTESDLDSVSNFLYMTEPFQFHKIIFHPEASVPGDIIKGQQHYLDSVTGTSNEILTRWLEADLDDEDSCYYVLMPTNKAWKEQYDANVKLFLYDKKVLGRDSLMCLYPRVNILMGLQFSKTTNPLLGTTEAIDSLMSPLAYPYYFYRKILYGSYDIHPYQFDKPYAQPNGIFTDIKGKKVCSNGVMLKTDNWKVKPSDTFLQQILMEAEYTRTLDSLSGATPDDKPTWTYTYVSPDNKFYDQVSEHYYQTLIPANLKYMGVQLNIEDVLSNQKYDMYVVTVPAIAGDTLATDTLPTRFGVTLYWHDMDGNEKSENIGEVKVGDSEIYKAEGEVSYDSSTRKYTFLTDPKKVHEIHIGTFEFPTCSYGLQTPQVKALLNVNVRSSDVNKGLYTRTLRVDCIKLVPHKDE